MPIMRALVLSNFHFEVTGISHVEVYLVTLRYWHNHYYTITISQPLFLTKILPRPITRCGCGRNNFCNVI
jgi:hypothetical protein